MSATTNRARYSAPTTLPELTASLATLMAGALNGEIKDSDARVALNAATRIIEVVQAETRIRALAHVTKTKMPDAIPLNAPIWNGGSSLVVGDGGEA